MIGALVVGKRFIVVTAMFGKSGSGEFQAGAISGAQVFARQQLLDLFEVLIVSFVGANAGEVFVGEPVVPEPMINERMLDDKIVLANGDFIF